MYHLPEQPDLIAENNKLPADGALWELFKSGDREAFAQIYQRHVQALYRYGLKINNNGQLVEDAIQEMFIYLWHTKQNLGTTHHIKYYLFKALRRRICLETARDFKKEQVGIGFAAEQPTAEVSPEHLLIAWQGQHTQQENMQQALRALTNRQREAIYLKFYDNLSYPEVAGIMGLQLKSTYNLVEKAVTVLREHLQTIMVSIFCFMSFPA